MTFPVTNPYIQFPDSDGQPLDSGYIYIGTVNLNAEANPITVYWDAAGTIPALQPLRTVNGYISRNGSPANVYTSASNYSIVVRNRNNAIVYSRLNSTAVELVNGILASSSGAGSISYTSDATGAITRTIADRLDDLQSVENFASLQDALDSGVSFFMPEGEYLANNLVQTYSNQCIIGIGNVVIKKNANGPLFTTSGAEVSIENVVFDGDFTANAYTGANIVSSGLRLSLYACGSINCQGLAVKSTGAGLRMYGYTEGYSSATVSSTSFDIEVGTSSVATIGHIIENIGFGSVFSNGGGIKMTDVGWSRISGCTFKNLTIERITPSILLGNNFISENLIIGSICSVDLPKTIFNSNSITGAITFLSNATNCVFDSSNAYATGELTITNNASNTNSIFKIVNSSNYYSMAAPISCQGVLVGSNQGLTGLTSGAAAASLIRIDSATDDVEVGNTLSVCSTEIKSGSGGVIISPNGNKDFHFLEGKMIPWFLDGTPANIGDPEIPFGKGCFNEVSVDSFNFTGSNVVAPAIKSGTIVVNSASWNASTLRLGLAGSMYIELQTSGSNVNARLWMKTQSNNTGTDTGTWALII